MENRLTKTGLGFRVSQPSRLTRLLEQWYKLQGNTRLRRWLRAGTPLLTVGFLVFLLFRGREELRQFDNWQAYLKVCFQAFWLYPPSLFVQAWAWTMMIGRLGEVTGGWHDVEIYAYTYLMRRLPGAIWYLAGRTVIYRERGIRASVTLAASGLELFLLLAVAVTLSVALSLPDRGSWLLAPALLLMLVLVLPRALTALPSASKWRWMPGAARERLANLSGAAMPKVTDLALWVALYVVAYVIGASILYLLIQAVAPASDVTLVMAIRIWALVVGVSFVVSLILPAALGIRELTLTALLSPYMPAVAALLVAVLVRLLFLVCDMVWGGLLWVTARAARRNR